MKSSSFSSSTFSFIEEVLPNGPSFEMVKVVGGRFRMGNDDSDYNDDKPAHGVSVSDFYLARYPVTNAGYTAFLNDYGSEKVKSGKYKGQKMIYEHAWGLQRQEKHWQYQKGYGNYPIINVTWYGAVEYCRWLSEQSGKTYRLPSEAEWEYAARGGSQSKNFVYSGGNKLKEVGWYRKNSHASTKPVGMKLPNELGLQDMSGNVSEWCGDVWHNNYEEAPKDGSIWEEGVDQGLRVVRGGSWFYTAINCRVANRFRDDADGRFSLLGFRVSRY